MESFIMYFYCTFTHARIMLTSCLRRQLSNTKDSTKTEESLLAEYSSPEAARHDHLNACCEDCLKQCDQRAHAEE